MKLLYVIRQRRSAIIAVCLVSAAAYFVHGVLTRREYTTFALVQGFASGGSGPAGSPPTAANEDFNTNIRILQSSELAQSVAAKLSDADRGRMLAPYTSLFQMGPAPSVAQIILEGRLISPGPSALNLDVGFRHPDPVIAATLANAFAGEFLRRHDALNADKAKSMVAALQAAADAQQKKIDAIQSQMDELTQKYGVTNIDATSTTVFASAIEELNKKVILDKAKLDELMLRGQQIQQQVSNSKSILELNFIGSQSHIVALEQAVQAAADQLKILQSQGYADEAPILAEGKGRVDAAIKELNDAAGAAVKQVAADLEAAQNNYSQSVDRLTSLQKQTQELSQQRARFDALRNDLNTALQMHSKQELAISDEQTKTKLNEVTYSIVARAEAPPTADPLPWLNLVLHSLGWGLGGGLLALAGFAVFLPPPVEQHQEYERRRRRHRHFHSSSRRRE